MDEYKRSRMANVLKAGGMGMEPEVYQAYASGISKRQGTTPESTAPTFTRAYAW